MGNPKLCFTCEHYKPCIDGAYDWDECLRSHDISDGLKTECQDYCMETGSMWNKMARENLK